MVCQAANTLIDLGVKTGDRVAIYMPMIPETVVAMLACARIGAPHTVVFGGFSVDGAARPDPGLRRPRRDHPDGGYRRGAPAALKPAVDEALEQCPDVRNVLVVRRTGQDVDWTEGRDVWWHDVRRRRVDRAHRPRRSTPSTRSTSCTPRARPASPRASCTPPAATWSARRTRTGRSSTSRDDDVFWTAADIGWVTGHSYIVYGPLANGATSVMYEGTPDTPHKGRWWEIIAEVQGHHPLLRADRDPHVHEVGRGHPGEVRPVDAADDRLGRRADQPRGLHLVPREHRRRPHARSSTPGGRPRPASHMISPLPGRDRRASRARR